MMLDTLHRRRALWHVLAVVVLVSTSRFSFGLRRDQESPEKAKSEPVTPSRAHGTVAQVNAEKGEKDAAKKSKGSVLTVVVTGKGQPIAQAEVKVRFPRGEERFLTNQAGEASFNSPGTGTAEVRVIVAGWESALREVALKEDPLRLTIDLKSLSDAK